MRGINCDVISTDNIYLPEQIELKENLSVTTITTADMHEITILQKPENY